MKSFAALRSKSEELLKFIKGIFSKKTLRSIVNELASPDQSDGKKAFSAGLGIFIGIIPLWGLQTITAVFTAITFKFNKALVVIFSQVSFPPIFPFIVFASYRIGRYWSGAHYGLNTKVWQYLYGSIILALMAGLAVGAATYFTLKIIRLFRQYNLPFRFKRMLEAS